VPDETPSNAKVGGRQAAYVARNRQAILEAGKRVLADIGPTATIEQISHEASVTHTTIYKYFANKECCSAKPSLRSGENGLPGR